MTFPEEAYAPNSRFGGVRRAALAFALVAASVTASDLRFFPIDSSETLTYKIRYIELGALHSVDSAMQTISGTRLIGDSLLVRRVETDSAGIRRVEADSCLVKDSMITCKQEIYHIAEVEGVQKAYKSYLQNAETSFYAFDSSHLAGTGVGGRRLEIFDARMGMIYSFTNRMRRISETQVEKTLVEYNGRPYDGKAVADSLRRLLPSSLAPRRRHVPQNETRDYFGVLRSGRNVLGRSSGSAGVPRFLE